LSTNDVSKKKIHGVTNWAQAMTNFANDIGEDMILNECSLALYKVNKLGCLKRIEERDVSMGIGRQFIKSSNGNMVLTRSTDMSLISLANFDPNNKMDMFFSIKAWSASLEDFAMPFKIDDNLNLGVNKYFKKV
jgi:hypothetical protein